MPRVCRSLAVLALFIVALVTAIPAQAAPLHDGGTHWASVLDWWGSWTASFTSPDPSQDTRLSVVVGREGPRISIDGFAPEGGLTDPNIESTTQSTLDPDEPPTEAGPSISPNG